MTKNQREILIDALRKLRDGAEHGIGLVRMGTSPVDLARHIAELTTCVEKIEDSFGQHVAATEVLRRLPEPRAKALSSSKRTP